MEFTGKKNNKIYTITIKDSEVESVLVESVNSCERNYYQREAKMNALVIDRKVFEEAVNAICRGDSEEWEKLYCEIRFDLHYAEMMKKAYKNYIQKFLKTRLHQDTFWN